MKQDRWDVDREQVVKGLEGARAFFAARADMAIGEGKTLLLSWAKACEAAAELLRAEEEDLK